MKRRSRLVEVSVKLDVVGGQAIVISISMGANWRPTGWARAPVRPISDDHLRNISTQQQSNRNIKNQFNEFW